MQYASLDPARSEAVPAPDRGSLLIAIVAGEGSGAHPWLHSAELNAGPAATRNMADLLHLLSLLHAAQPCLAETVAAQNVWPGADAWLLAACAGFAVERDYLAQLIVAAGPVPSTPGEAATVAAVLAQRQALATIGRSDRFGCAIGAFAALLLDWQPIRATLDTAAYRLGVAPSPVTLPGEAETAALLDGLPEQPRLARTLAFGARQLLTHHQCLWELLELRAGAREQ